MDRLSSTANDDYYSIQSSLHSSNPNVHINIENAWTYSTGRSSMKVGIFDSGIDFFHEEFLNPIPYSQVVSGGYDYVNGNYNYMDIHGHGTCVAGIIGAHRNNSLGVAGIAGGNGSIGSGIRMYSMKIGSLDGEDVNIIKADMAAAILQGALNTTDGGFGLHVFNLSVGGDQPSYIVRDNLKTAWKNGVSVVASKGNDDMLIAHYPADHDDHLVVCVGGSGIDGNRGTGYSFLNYHGSNYGYNMDLIAPAYPLFYIYNKLGWRYLFYSQLQHFWCDISCNTSCYRCYLFASKLSYGSN